MSKKKLLLIIISVVVLAAVIACIGLSRPLSPYEKQIELAYKLLEDGSYEEAILAFDKAIEIDAKRVKAYVGKADAYMARGDENTLEDIKAVMELAYSQHYDDDAVVEAIMKLSEELMIKGNSEWATELLDFGYELTNDERLKEHKNALFDIFAADFLKILYEMFEAGDEAGVKSEIQSEKYLSFMELVNDSEYKYIYFPKKNNNQTGKGIALYYVESKNYGNVFVYYGDYENGKRSGTGTWVGASGIQYYWFEGQWSDDAPNGDGSFVTVKDESKIEKKSGRTYGIKTEISGSFKNGLYHGTINEIWTMDDGDVLVWKPIAAVDGVYQEMSPLPADIMENDYAQEQYAEGKYLVSVTEDGGDLWDNGEVKCVLGFN